MSPYGGQTTCRRNLANKCSQNCNISAVVHLIPISLGYILCGLPSNINVQAQYRNTSVA
jgi:hypothetical protein